MTFSIILLLSFTSIPSILTIFIDALFWGTGDTSICAVDAFLISLFSFPVNAIVIGFISFTVPTTVGRQSSGLVPTVKEIES